MKKTFWARLAAGMMLAGMAGTSYATQINDTTLVPPYTAGTGNSSDHFAVSTGVNGEQVALKAKLRFLGDAPTVGNVYYVPTGYQASPTTYANWNFDFSVRTLTASDYTTLFSFDIDPTAGTNYKTFSFPSSADPQDSWNYGMAFLGLTGFNANLNGLYDIDLSLLDVNGNTLADSHIQVVAGSGAPVPEPGTMMLLGAGFLGLAVYGKRRKNA